MQDRDVPVRKAFLPVSTYNSLLKVQLPLQSFNFARNLDRSDFASQTRMVAQTMLLSWPSRGVAVSVCGHCNCPSGDTNSLEEDPKESVFCHGLEGGVPVIHNKRQDTFGWNDSARSVLSASSGTIPSFG